MSEQSEIPPSVDNLLRWTVLGILIVFFVLPFIFYMTAVMPIQNKVGKVLERSADMMERSFRGDRGIIAGGDPAALKAIADRLRDLTASTGEAAHYNRTLHVVVVETTGPPAASIAVDLGRAGDAAAVFVASSPIVWHVANASPKHRGKISFEGPAAFDIVNAHQGLIGGFRIGAFGANRTTAPRDAMADASTQGRFRFCSMLKAWAQYYNVSPSSIYLFHLRDPKRVSLTPDEVVGEGSPRIASEIESGLCDFRRWRFSR